MVNKTFLSVNQPAVIFPSRTPCSLRGNKWGVRGVSACSQLNPTWSVEVSEHDYANLRITRSFKNRSHLMAIGEDFFFMCSNNTQKLKNKIFSKNVKHISILKPDKHISITLPNEIFSTNIAIQHFFSSYSSKLAK